MVGAVKGGELVRLRATAIVLDSRTFPVSDAELDQASIETSHHDLHASNICAGLNRLVRQGDLIEAKGRTDFVDQRLRL